MKLAAVLHGALAIGARNFFFAAPFDTPPVVHLGLTGFDLDKRDSNRLSLRASEIGTASFVAEIATWRDTRVYSVEFSWLAIGA